MISALVTGILYYDVPRMTIILCIFGRGLIICSRLAIVSNSDSNPAYPNQGRSQDFQEGYLYSRARKSFCSHAHLVTPPSN